MSSDENKYTKQHEKNNLIYFPLQTQQDAELEQQDAELEQQDVELEQQDIELENKEKASQFADHKKDSNHLKFVDPNAVGDSPEEVASWQDSRYVFSGVACALFLMLIGVPFLNVSDAKNNNRVPVSQGEKLRIEKKQEQIRKQEKHILKLLKTGRREIASVGRKPPVRDLFAINFLKSRYTIQWNSNRKLDVVLLSDGEEPVEVPSVGKMLAKYPSLFPHYAQVKKEDNPTGDLEIHQLQDERGFVKAKIETLKNEEGRLLSIHVMK